MAKGSVRKARSGTTAFTLKMKAADRYSESSQVRKARAKPKLCFAKQWKTTKQRNS